MGSPNGTTLHDASTYQAIIIALVVGAILAIALITWFLRRRRRQFFLQQIMHARHREDTRNGRGTLRWMELADGRMMQVRGGGSGEGVAVQPQIWDVGLGNRPAEMYPDEFGEKIILKEGEEEDASAEVDVVGLFDADWRPLSTTLPDHSSDPTFPAAQPSADASSTAQNIQLSVLIAMPSPDQVVTSASTSATSISYEKPIHLDDYPILHALPDSEYLPSLEIGTVHARVKTGRTDQESWKEITREVDERYWRHQELTGRRR